MELHKILHPDLIFVKESHPNKESVLSRIADAFASAGIGKDADEMLKKFLAREEISSTGIGHGIAVPHIFLEETEKAHLLIITLKEGMDFKAHDKNPVHTVLGLVANRNMHASHLQTLAKISRIFIKQEYSEKINLASSAEAIKEILKEV
jgi:mannitol/fructose-specific phosphotransferase system IIA component (Ntr-type)